MRIHIALAAAIALAGCKRDVAPPAPVEDLPTWDEVPSGHPPGATDPPIPNLVITPDGRCHKLWRSPMMRPTPGKFGRYVDPDCEGEACGVPIQCPDDAAGILEAWLTREPPESR